MADLKIGVLSVATNKYVGYWSDLLHSALNQGCSKNFVFHIFTDQIEEVRKITQNFPDMDVRPHEIASLGWPEATLHRYRIFSEHASVIEEPFLMHLDADMLVISNFEVDLLRNLKEGIGLVRHPGYYRAQGIKRIYFYLTHPLFFIRDMKSILLVGGLGSWETSPTSRAYVPKSKRKVYVCGGTWFGYRTSFFNMVHELAENEKLDSDNNIVANWHDESHINWWKAFNECTIFEPSYCFEPTYPNLYGLPEFIRAINKKVVTK